MDTTNEFSKALADARTAGASDLQILVRDEVLTLRHRVSGLMYAPKVNTTARTFVLAFLEQLLEADMSPKDCERYKDFIAGRISTFGFRLPAEFVQGQVHGCKDDCQLVLRLFNGRPEFTTFIQRILAPAI